MTLIATIVLIVLLIGIALWALERHGREVVEDRIRALDISAEHKRAAMECFERAGRADSLPRKIGQHLLAPIVLLPVCLRLPLSANELPARYAKWANNVSVNGDGMALLRDGKWLTAGEDIDWPTFNAAVDAGERVYRYSDADYAGPAYYAWSWVPKRWRHPRHWLQRWCWLGFRNVQSQRAIDAGVDVTERPAILAGAAGFGTAKEGWMLLWDGDDGYQWRSADKAGSLPICVWRNIGLKLDVVRNSASGLGRAAVTGTWVSFKRWKG